MTSTIKNQALKFEDVLIDTTLTLNASGYVNILQYRPQHAIVFAVMRNWQSSTGAFSMFGDGYIQGTPNAVIERPTIRYFYYQ